MYRILKWILASSTLGIFLFVIYLIFNPVTHDTLRLISPRSIPNMAYARNYYTVISSISTVIIGFFGLALGWFYYHDRQKHEELVRETQRQHNRLELFIYEINQIDELVTKILYGHFDTKKELGWFRGNIRKHFETIQSMLRTAEELMGLNPEEIDTVYDFYAFVDTSDAIMEHTPKQLESKDSETVRDTYLKQLRLIRNAYYERTRIS